ncbi:PR-1-like protein [Glarea lozoyensis ATCC 20868]|uniref:PR-1-like protein n=1 Tax=Glarea lozoyensis (strain ATCC 20868 / MF5171) TaxID=1116229 RepID=S3DEI7_GLAL2|nr:PR-1-like protein [Glarea lozoyensis ATCC 20868]EPE30381.1 PR-1-like protein [Glarea lozoyensis ATCC 20868]
MAPGSSRKAPILLLATLLSSKVASTPIHHHLHARQVVVTVTAPPVIVTQTPQSNGDGQNGNVVVVWTTVGVPPAGQPDQHQQQNPPQQQENKPEDKPEDKPDDKPQNQDQNSGQKVKGPDSFSDSNFKSQMLATHNYFRKQHSASDLTWNDNLADQSKEWAKGCKFAHSGMPGGGENIAAGYDSVGKVVDGWGLERKSFNFNGGGFDMGTGHFTQVVWKGTSSVGCAAQACDNGFNPPLDPSMGKWFVVCRYADAGNMEGAFGDNVKPGGGDGFQLDKGVQDAGW